MRSIFASIIHLLLVPSLFAQSSWLIEARNDREIKIDGFLEDWPEGPSVVLAPAGANLESSGALQESDFRVTLRGLWDKNYLYLAVRWEDDQWDIQEIKRSEATWITPDRRRRDRMLFYDYLKFQIRKSDYDYTLWLSPRIESRGPFLWERLLKGAKGMETATRPPLISSRQHADHVSMEVMFLWKELDLKPKEGREMPLFLVLSDSDRPGIPLESKLNTLKWVRWRGILRLGNSPD